MKASLRPFLVAATLPLAAVSTQAQVLTADTITGMSGSGQLLSDGVGYTQTFTNITDISSLTFRFVAGTGGGAVTNLDFYFTQWAPDGFPIQQALGNLNAGPQTLSIPGAASWQAFDGSTDYFDASIDLSGVSFPLNASATYALTIVGNAVTAANSIALALGGSNYADGQNMFTSPVASYADLSTINANLIGSDFAFTTTVTPIPEASHAAVLFTALFVGALMCRRRGHVGSAQLQV